MTETCEHFGLARDMPPSADGCEECLATGGRWVHLRRCLICGHVGCCDSSPRRHARAHHGATGHPVVMSFEPGETWVYCFEHDLVADGLDIPPATG